MGFLATVSVLGNYEKDVGYDGTKKRNAEALNQFEKINEFKFFLKFKTEL